jgi:hypothetical protein
LESSSGQKKSVTNLWSVDAQRIGQIEQMILFLLDDLSKHFSERKFTT